MNSITCPNCASSNFNDIGFGKYICQYCGTVVELDNGNVYRLEICEKSVKYLESRLVLPAENRDYLVRQQILDTKVREVLIGDGSDSWSANGAYEWEYCKLWEGDENEIN